MNPTQPLDHDPVNHPSHYTSHPSRVECITITEHMSFCVGNAIKYLWRAGQKGAQAEDLKKARWYIDREIKRLEELKDRAMGVTSKPVKPAEIVVCHGCGRVFSAVLPMTCSCGASL